MKCNACWRELEERSIATTCGHIFCSEDASRILSSDSTCPVCDQILSKSQMKAVDLSPADEWVNMAMAGVPPQAIMKCAFKGIAFWIAQKDVETQLTVSKAMQLRRRHEEMQAKFMEKLQQLHAAYQKAMKKVKALEEEIESLNKDKNELQEKYSEKSRQKRKLEEMYDALRNEYEKLKKIGGHMQQQKEHNMLQMQRSSVQDMFNTPTNHFDHHHNARPNPDDSVSAPVTPAQPSDFWPTRSHTHHRNNNSSNNNNNSSGGGMFDLVVPGLPPSMGAMHKTIGKSSSSPFKGAGKSSLFTPAGTNPSQTLRNLLLSPPVKRNQSRLRAPPGFTS